MYMNQNELYIDKVTNLALSGIDETRSASSSSSTNGQTVTTTFSFSSPSIGCLAGIYRGSISFTVSGYYVSDSSPYLNSATCRGIFSLGGTYRDVTKFSSPVAGVSLTNITLVSGTHTSSASSYGSGYTKSYSGVSDLRNYFRVA